MYSVQIICNLLHHYLYTYTPTPQFIICTPTPRVFKYCQPPLLFPRFPEQFLQEGFCIVVDAQDADAQHQAHVPADIGDETAGVVYDVLLPLFVGPLSDDNLEYQLLLSDAVFD